MDRAEQCQKRKKIRPIASVTDAQLPPRKQPKCRVISGGKPRGGSLRALIAFLTNCE